MNVRTTNLKSVISSNRNNKIGTKTLITSNHYEIPSNSNTNKKKGVIENKTKNTIELVNSMGLPSGILNSLNINPINSVSPSYLKKVDRLEQPDKFELDKALRSSSNSGQNSNGNIPLKPNKQSKFIKTLREDKIKIRHQKHISEIPSNLDYNYLNPDSLNNSNDEVENYIKQSKENQYNNTSSNNFYVPLSKNNNKIVLLNDNSIILTNNPISNTANKVFKSREVIDKSDQDPRLHKTKSQSNFTTSANRVRIISVDNEVEINKHKKQTVVNTLQSFRRTDSYNENTEYENNNDKDELKQDSLADKNLAKNYNEIKQQNKELLKTVEILKSYILTGDDMIKKKNKENLEKLSKGEKTLKKLQIENEIIIKENKELKCNMLKVIFYVKEYEINENLREKDVNVEYKL